MYLSTVLIPHHMWPIYAFICSWHHDNIKMLYEGESNENSKTEIKIRNIAPLSYKLADMLPML
jgi:hypothetical protein